MGDEPLMPLSHPCFFLKISVCCPSWSVGFLLLVSDFREFDVFSAVVVLFESYGVEGLFRENFPLLSKYIEGMSNNHLQSVNGVEYSHFVVRFVFLICHYRICNIWCFIAFFFSVYDVVAEDTIPALWKHFETEGVLPPVYLHQWLVFTLFYIY